MKISRIMRHFARWHIWLGWLIAIPLLLWTASGLLMVLRPIEEVRGTTLHRDHPPQPVRITLSGGQTGALLLREGQLLNQRGKSILLATAMDGTVTRIDLSDGNVPLPPVDEAEARRAVAHAIKGGDRVAAVRFYPANAVPFDFRRPMPVWQVTLDDQTRVYVGRATGEIEAVRTRWWRAFDFMWGLHIMDPVEREDTSHPLLIASAALALLGVLLGSALLFRRRRAPRS
ncbi:PepSY domain-containing protein [Novosphingobium arvoryzae]|nr:PepSY domain-containing protein [Novosphingobium arvoryzae]